MIPVLCDLKNSVSLEDVIPRTRARLTPDSETGCWIWRNRNVNSGYGPYRWIYERYVGKSPRGMQIHHVCRNGAGGCVNPGHMELISATEHHQLHARDHFAVITADQARHIREELLPDLSMTTQEIADLFGVHRNIVERIGMGRIWSDVAPGALEYEQTCGWCGVTFETPNRRKRYCCTTHQRWFSDRQRYLRRRGTDSTYVRPRRGRLPDPMEVV